jgi:hypothetical protein
MLQLKARQYNAQHQSLVLMPNTAKQQLFLSS